MNNFGYSQAESPAAALAALQKTSRASLLAGGTDLIPLMKDGIQEPLHLVDIKAWRDGSGINVRDDGARIGALTPLSALADDPSIRSSYTALSDACRLAASTQLRNMGTIGGNLLQQTRCWYFRGPYHCWLKGGDTCFARDGENEQHALFGANQSQCVSAHPSDPAAALLALDAKLTIVSPAGQSEVALSDLFTLPTQTHRSFVNLPENAVITEVVLPSATFSPRSIYLKAMPRALWAFALAGVALYLEVEAGVIKMARLALSGVAPIPWRISSIEAALAGRPVTALDNEHLTALLLADAHPLSQNAYKMTLLRGLFVQALDALLT